jgi:hypothetical protein
MQAASQPRAGAQYTSNDPVPTLSPDQLEKNFAEIAPPLTRDAALL